MIGAIVVVMSLAGTAPVTPAEDVGSAPDAATDAVLDGAAVSEVARAPAPIPWLELHVANCEGHLAAQRYRRARFCFERGAALSPGDASALAPLADAAGRLEGAARISRRRAALTDRVAAFTLSGKPEMIALAAVWGGFVNIWFAALLGSARISAAPNLGPTGPELAATVFSPVAGGVVGLAGAGALTIALGDTLTDGDANLLRVALLSGLAHGALALVLLPNYLPSANVLSAESLTGGVLLGATVPVAAAGLVAATTEIPAGASALALSASWTSAALFALSVLALDVEIDPLTVGVGALAIADLAALATVTAGPWLPIERVETWALDLGAVVGFGLGAALAFGIPAPNPLLGWGTMASGLVVGGALGLGAAKLTTFALDALDTEGLDFGGGPTLSFLPLLAPDLDSGRVVVGAQIAMPLDPIWDGR